MPYRFEIYQLSPQHAWVCMRRGRSEVVKIGRWLLALRRTAPHSLGRGRHYWGKLPEKFANPTLGKVGEGGQVGSEGWKWGGNMRRWSPYYWHIGDPGSLGMGEVLGEFQGVVEDLIWNIPTSSHQQSDWDFKVKSWIFLYKVFPMSGCHHL